MWIRLAYLLSFLAVASLASCKKGSRNQISEAEQETSPTGMPAAPAPPIRDDPKDIQRFITAVVPYIRAQRESDIPFHATHPIEQLFTVWNPVGRTSQELKSMIGEPTHVTNGKLDYMLLTAPKEASGGYVFEFLITDDRVMKFDSYVLD